MELEDMNKVWMIEMEFNLMHLNKVEKNGVWRTEMEFVGQE